MNFAKLREDKRLLILWLSVAVILLTCAACLFRIDPSLRSSDIEIAHKIFGDDVQVGYKDPLSCPQGLGPIADYCRQVSDLLATNLSRDNERSGSASEDATSPWCPALSG